MKLLAENSSALHTCIDQAHAAAASIVCRYRHALQFDEQPARDLACKDLLLESSLGEGVRTFHLTTYKGVSLHLLDETTGMTGGSLKAIDGCLAAALCRLDGVGRIVFESGGNTGAALTRYGAAAGVETFFFCPLENLDLLESALFDCRRAHLIGVGERDRVKEFAALFARETGIRHLPEKSWRYAAAMFRGLFILEQMLAGGRFDWISQAVSAAFGPIGIFRVLAPFRAELGGMPRFLGIQQQANCPLVDAWTQQPAREKPARLLTRIMYDHSPETYATVGDLMQLLQATRGELLTVDEEEFSRSLISPAGDLLELLAARGVAITRKGGEVLEKTGLLALAGTLKAIDAGTIEAGSRVLCCLTSGVSAADGLAQPEEVVRRPEEVLEYIAKIKGGNEGRPPNG